MKPAISAWVARDCDRVLGQELSEEEAAHPEVVRGAKGKEQEAWKSFGVLTPLRAGDFGKSAADTRRVLTWKTVEGVTPVKPRLAAEDFQDPALKDGIVDTAGCVSLRSHHLQVTKKWELQSLGVENAFLQGRVFARPPTMRAVFGN